MDITANRAAKLTAALLIVTVISQIIYIVISNDGGEPPRMLIWTTEAVAFMGIATFALVVLARTISNAAAWAALAMGGLLNVIQVGMGLAMFGPLKDAGEAMAPAMDAVLFGAFFLYFAGKFLFGFAALLLGSIMLRGSGAAKVVGGLSLLAGIGAVLANLRAMAIGMEGLYPAAATGTAAALFLAIAIWMSVTKDEDAA